MRKDCFHRSQKAIFLILEHNNNQSRNPSSKPSMLKKYGRKINNWKVKDWKKGDIQRENPRTSNKKIKS